MRKLWVVIAVLWATTALAASKETTLEVKGWSCGSCATATKVALKKLDGVQKVTTDVKQASVRIRYEETKVTPERLVQTIRALGYDATVQVPDSIGSAPSRPSQGGSKP